MSDRRRPGLSTRCVHGAGRDDPHGALHPPLYDHSTFGFADTAALLSAADEESSKAFYTRYGSNPTVVAAERQLASIEGAETALLFGSGLAAMTAAVLGARGAAGKVVWFGDVYGGTHELLGERLAGLGVQTLFLQADELDRLPTALVDDIALVGFETPTNPSLDVYDIARISAMARARGARTLVDGTFATPVNQRPLAHGADLVVHSATKYLGGHSDLTGGAVLGSVASLRPIAVWRRTFGSVIAPSVAALLSRSLRTLVVRVRAQTASAAELARRLAAHRAVHRVRYPGLLDHPGHAIAARQMDGFGAMLSFEVRGDGREIVDRLRLFAIAPSLGGVESLATQPVTTTHRTMPLAERARRGIRPGMIRLSVGLEDVEDLWEDLAGALGQV